MTRRAELVDAAIVAIRERGAAVGMDEVAARAGTSKTVLYRHFADRADLYVAVCERVADALVAEIRTATASADGPRAATAAAIDAFLRLIESDREVYRFVAHRPLLDRGVGTDRSGNLCSRIGDRMAAVLAEHLPRGGRAGAAAHPWGHGAVGLVQAAADNWLARPDGMSREALTAHLTDLSWSGLSGVVRAATPRDGGS